MATLREQMQRDLQLRGLSPKTQRAYLDKARDFARYFKQAPDQLGEGEIKEYLHYLLAEKKVSDSTYRQTYGSLKFLNHRIINVEDGRVSFWWRDYADGNKKKIMALDAPEFIRRFLLHVLPDRFVKIRHYGLLGSRNCKNNLTLCR